MRKDTNSKKVCHLKKRRTHNTTSTDGDPLVEEVAGGGRQRRSNKGEELAWIRSQNWQERGANQDVPVAGMPVSKASQRRQRSLEGVVLGLWMPATRGSAVVRGDVDGTTFASVGSFVDVRGRSAMDRGPSTAAALMAGEGDPSWNAAATTAVPVSPMVMM